MGTELDCVLQFSVEANNAGVCVDMNDRMQIESALRKMDDNYELFSRASQQLYESVDIRAIIRLIIDRACIHNKSQS